MAKYTNLSRCQPRGKRFKNLNSDTVLIDNAFGDQGVDITDTSSDTQFLSEQNIPPNGREWQQDHL